MKTNLFLEVKKVVKYYSEYRKKEKMGFSVTLKDTENFPVKIKKMNGGRK